MTVHVTDRAIVGNGVELAESQGDNVDADAAAWSTVPHFPAPRD
jgi:hypothetical protein